MPSCDTLSIYPIKCFVARYMQSSQLSVDPFARNSRVANYRNDLNPETAAEYHMDACDFLAKMKDDGVRADLLIFDPPYSSRQVAECYAQVGRKATQEDTQGLSWRLWKKAAAEIVKEGGHILSFGWNSNGIGKKNGFEIVEIMTVAHGGVHNDTICVAEVKLPDERTLFDRTQPITPEPK